MKHGPNAQADAPTAIVGSGQWPTFTFERTCRARLERLWELWTTAAGLKSWWAAEDFRTRILTLDLRPGGEWCLETTASAPAPVAALRRAGAGLTIRVRATYTEVQAPRRLRYTAPVDYLRGVRPYEVAVLLELYAALEEALMVVTVDAMHDAACTQRALREWEGRLGRLAQQLGSAAL